MSPILIDVSDIQDMIESKASVLEGTFLNPLHLLCLVVSYASELRLIAAEDVLDDANIDLWNEINNYVPRTFSDDQLNDLLNFIICDIKPYIDNSLLAQLDNMNLPLQKMYAYPVTAGVVVVLDEESHETQWQNLFNSNKPNHRTKSL